MWLYLFGRTFCNLYNFVYSYHHNTNIEVKIIFDKAQKFLKNTIYFPVGNFKHEELLNKLF